MKKLLNIELTDEEFDYLICEQAKGKELKIIDGKVNAVEYIPTEEELTKIKQQRYENIIVSKIRERYSLDQELAVLRQRDTKPKEFSEYNNYVEQCKIEAKQEV